MAKIAPLYKAYSADFFYAQEAKIEKILEKNAQKKIEVFFRADDIAVPSRLFSEMIALFKKHQMPLCLAVVPSWLTEKRFASLINTTGLDNLWCWHQHGRRHTNHELEGKKQEFGPARDTEVADDIEKGKKRLQQLMGDSLQPFFTPPWNRCSATAMNALQQQGFIGLSRFVRAQPLPPQGLTDFAVNFDLHTRREDAELSLEKLYQEFELALESGRCGVMLHHQCMNNKAFIFLDVLMKVLAKQPNITFTDFAGMHKSHKNL